MDVLVVNGWSRFNRGDLAIALGTVALWRGNPNVRRILIRSMDGRTVSLSQLHEDASDPSPWPEASSATPLQGRLLEDVRTVASWARGRGSRIRRGSAPDVVLSMGGHYLKAGSTSPLRGELRMRRLLAPLRDAYSNDTPFAFWGHSVGPFATPAATRELVQLANASMSFACRERFSAAALEGLGVWPGKVELIGDPAFHIEAPGSQALAVCLDHFGLKRKDYIAVTVRQPEGRISRPEVYRRYLTAITEFVRQKSKETQVVLVAQCTGPTADEDDRRSIRAIAAQFDGNPAVRALETLSLIDVLSVYAGASYVLATRLHSAILAFVSGTPAIGISYSGMKTPGVFDQLGMLDYVCKYSELDTSWMLERSAALESSLRALSESICVGVEATKATGIELRDWTVSRLFNSVAS